MTIPASVTTATVFINAPISFVGDPGIVHLTITPSEQLVHAATGTPLVNFVDSIEPSAGEQASIILPHTDQPGFLDASGAAFTDWYYTASIKYEKDGQFFEFPERDFQIATGQDSLDLALVPSGTASTPSTAPRADVLSINGQTGIISLTKSWVGLDQVDDTSDVNKPVSTAQQTALNGKANTVHRHTYADIDGTVPTSALPPLAINDTFPVSSQAAMLALTAQRGDMAIRTDINKTYVLSTDSPSTLADWKEVMASGQVLSVAGKTGTVVLSKGDVGLSNVDNTSDVNKPVSTAQQTALNLKVDNSKLGAANGVATLGSDGTLTVGQQRPVASMSAGQDLNTYTTTGQWNVQANATASGGTNYPVPYSGLLEVISWTASSVLQRYTQWGADGGVWVRHMYGSNWSAWTQMASFGNSEPPIAAGTTAQYWRGDKTWQSVQYSDIASAPQLDSVTDLNTLMTDTVMGQVSSSHAAGAPNYPLGMAGLLTVHRVPNTDLFVYQTYTSYSPGGNRLFIRSYYKTSWGAWVEFAATSYVDTAVAPKADKTYVDSGLGGKVDKPAAFKDAVTSQGPDSVVSIGSSRLKPGIDSRYAAFPSVTKLADGTLMMVWREDADHLTTRAGVVRTSRSTDYGQTWSAATTLVSIGGIDLRDPTISISTDNSTLYLTYIKATAAAPANGYYLKISTDQGVTWGAEKRIDALAYAAGTSQIRQMANGNLIATWYGKLAGTEAYDSVWISISTNNGATWGTQKKLVDGVTAGTDMQEPTVDTYGNSVVILHRWGNQSDIGRLISTDNGATWSASAIAFHGYGRPGFIITERGTLIVVFRYLVGGASTMHGMMRTSQDLGVTWTEPHLVERANPSMWTYSGMWEVARGQIICVTTIEVSSTSSVMSIRYLTEGRGVSPYGDETPSAIERSVQRLSALAVTDSFDRAPGPLGQSDNGQDWMGSTAPTIQSGTYYDASGSPSVVYANALSADVEIEAEFMWTGVAGFYLIFRVQDTSNYLMFGIETAGQNARLYKVVGGTATQLGTQALSVPANAFHKLKVSTVGDNIRCYVEDVSVMTVTDSTLDTQSGVGIRTGVAAGTHRARFFRAYRRGLPPTVMS